MTAYPTRTLVLRGLLAILVAAALNAGLVALARAVDLAPGFEPIAYPPVIFLTVFGLLAATAVFAATLRLSPRPADTFRLVALVALVVSLVPDLLLLRIDPAATVPGVLLLMGMHVVAAVTVVGLLLRDPEASP